LALPAGSRLGSYEIVAPLGAGGMGEVYRAKDLRLGREVALKVLPADVAADPDRLARFEHEARTVAGLSHPNIVMVHSIEDDGGIRFIAMELVEGKSLDKHVTAGGLPVARLLELGIALADALASAHEKGVIHRDLKPANVMLTPEGRVKVLDFGLAKLTSNAPGFAGEATQAPTHVTPLSIAGLVVGTVPYMAPEQVRGEAVDARTDLFALGIVLYELVAGRRPFGGATSADISSAILRDGPKPLAYGRSDLPGELELVIGRCLEKSPRDRFQTALDVGNELRRIQQALERGDRPAANSPRDVTPAPVSIAVLPFSDMSAAKDQDYLCEGMAEEIMNALVRIDGIRVASRTSAFRAGKNGDDLAAISRALSVGHVLEGSVRTAGVRLRVTAQLTDVASGYQLWSERYDREAIDVFAIQDEISAGVVEAVKSRLSPSPHTVPARPQAHNLDAYRSYLRGRHLRGVEDFGGALSAFQEAVRLDPAHAASWTGLAEITVLSAHMGMIMPRAAWTAARTMLATARELQGESAEGCHVEAFAAFLERRWDAMETAWRRALTLQPDHVLSLGSFALSLCGRQRLDEALPLFERAKEADPLASFPYTLAGWGWIACGRPDEGLRVIEDALTFEKDDASAISASCMANVALGRFEDAIAAGERGVVVAYRAPFFLGLLGWALASAGRKDEARTVLEELRARPAGSPTAVSEVWILGALGELDSAFDVLARAEEEHQGLLCYTGVPGFDALRSDARFAALMKRLELSPA
jgi:TolB-like protein/Flp pilus assembly protein TadD